MTFGATATRSVLLLQLRETIDMSWSMIDDADPTIRALAREMFRDAAERYRAVAR